VIQVLSGSGIAQKWVHVIMNSCISLFLVEDHGIESKRSADFFAKALFDHFGSN